MSTGTLTTVGQAILHPPLGFLSLEAIAGNPHSGHNVLTRPRGVHNTDAKGVRWSTDVIPPGYGRRNSWSSISVADRTICTISNVYTIQGGADLQAQRSEWSHLTGFILFEQALPFSVIFDIAPGVEMTLHWLLFLE